MLDGARRFICLIVQLAEIVVRGGVSRRDCQRTEECFPRHIELPAGPLGERQIHERIEILRIEREHRTKLRGRLIRLSLHEQGHTVVVSGARVARFDQDCALQLARRLLQQILLLVQQPEIIVRLSVQFIPLQERTVVLERVLEITRTMIVERQL